MPARDQDDLRPAVHAHDAEAAFVAPAAAAVLRPRQFPLEEGGHVVSPVLERHRQSGAAVLPRFAYLYTGWAWWSETGLG